MALDWILDSFPGSEVTLLFTIRVSGWDFEVIKEVYA